jgi:predicted DNA binding CopG/RHH family protein
MSMLPKHKDPRTLTRLEKQKQAQRVAAETEELIDELGQTSDRKAVRSVHQYVKENNELDRRERQGNIENLKRLSRNKLHYQRYLISVLHKFVKEEAISKKYKLYVDSDDTGIVLGIVDTEYYGAFKVCGMPEYDINACKILAVKLGNTVAILEGHLRKTDSGIIVTNKAETDLVLRQLKKKHG